MTDQKSADFGAMGVPQDAIKRLAELTPGKAGGIFTSDLSVNEFLLVREAGFRPLGLVLGSSIYHVGLQIGRWSKNQELDVLSQAMYHARELAMTRMEVEARTLGADGVVGVRLDVEMKEFGTDIAEFIAIGTAVRPLRADHVIERPTMVLSLDARPWTAEPRRLSLIRSRRATRVPALACAVCAGRQFPGRGPVLRPRRKPCPRPAPFPPRRPEPSAHKSLSYGDSRAPRAVGAS